MSFKDLPNRMRTLRELFAFLWASKLWWLTPMIVILAVLAMIVVTAQSSALAPFLYPLF